MPQKLAARWVERTGCGRNVLLQRCTCKNTPPHVPDRMITVRWMATACSFIRDSYSHSWLGNGEQLKTKTASRLAHGCRDWCGGICCVHCCAEVFRCQTCQRRRGRGRLEQTSGSPCPTTRQHSCCLSLPIGSPHSWNEVTTT